ncbi:MAG TPA: prepilin-type N-terminal cleavage/methylation domain-containing protein [Terriglobales bacterium]|jgi:type II secretory pathway pseudopilin PulG|nr:prepilin-type N-terminal cleavage/methylation domain-containing protein [Terriglobales bacterium]
MNKIQLKSTKGNKGFTLMEALISTVILTVGLLMVLALFAKGLSATQYAQQDMIAKQKAREQLEAIYSARNDGRITWANITNTPQPAPAIYFPSGFNPLYRITDSSTDLVGSNNNSGVTDFIVTRDVNGNFQKVNLNNYTRQVDIQLVNPTDPTLKQITVTVRVLTPGVGSRDYQVIGYVSQTQ